MMMLFQSTEEDHSDYRHLMDAVQVMTEVVMAINEFKRRKDLGQCLFHTFAALSVLSILR